MVNREETLGFFPNPGKVAPLRQSTGMFHTSNDSTFWQAESILARTPTDDPFTRYWEHPSDFIEPKNSRRGGWSGVSRIEMPGRDRQPVEAFLKRQENHTYRAPHTLFRKTATLRREFENLRVLGDLGFRVPRPLFFGQRTRAGNLQAVLILQSMNGFQSLRDFLKLCQSPSSPERSRQQRTLARVAAEVAKLHALGWIHRCLYGKHIFVSTDPDSTEVAFIDLETARRVSPLTRRHRLKELGPLYRRCAPLLSQQDCLRFLYAYTGQDRPCPRTRELAAQIAGSKKSRRP